MTKKTNKKSTVKVKIADVDSMVEEMKNLAMSEPQDIVEDVNDLETKKPESVENTEEVPESVENVEEESESGVENVEEDAESGTENVEEVPESGTENVEEVPESIDEKGEVEDLSFIDEIKESEEASNKTSESVNENNPKRMTYQEMFGHCWMGYGFSE